jgi:LysM repeat protein
MDVHARQEIRRYREDESLGLAGSAADRLAAEALASGPSAPSSARASTAAAPDAELAGLVAPARVAERPVHGYQPPARPGNRPRVSSTRTAPRDVITGPAWEHSRRSEAYPTIRTRVGLPPMPRVLVLAVALAIAALGLFFLPALLGVGGGGVAPASPSPSATQAVASASPVVTPAPAPTAEVYVVKSGDTMSKIASRFGLTLQELCDANKETVPDCDKIGIGNEIIIPSKPPDVINDSSAAPSPS